MFKFYSEKEVKMLVQKLKEEYDAVLKGQADVCNELKEENRLLRARLSVLEGQRGEVSSALMRAVSEGEKIKQESAAQGENERKELLLLAEKCRLLCDKLQAKYPDEEDCADFEQFTSALRSRLGEDVEEEESGFRMEDVLNPQTPLDLESLCRDLGLMEEEL